MMASKCTLRGPSVQTGPSADNAASPVVASTGSLTDVVAPRVGRDREAPFLEGHIRWGATGPAGVTEEHRPGPRNASFVGVAPDFTPTLLPVPALDQDGHFVQCLRAVLEYVV